MWAMLACAILASAAHADAVIRTQAMFATTIAEIDIEKSGLLVRLEIGIGDIDAFRNLLPDELYERLGHAPRPLADPTTGPAGSR